jgi:hypothetical protein
VPVAVVTDTAGVKEDLKSLEGGFVIIKRMTYGQKLIKSQLTMKMRMDMQDKKKMGADIDLATRAVALWSFANLIEDHNLEDASGRKLNFRSPADVEALAGKIGEEIDTLIDKHNNFEEDDETENLSNGSESQS